MAPPDLGLDLKLSTTKIVKTLTEEDPSIEDYEQKVTKIEQQIRNFEEERRKVDVFKRDLPFCMFLLDDVIDGLKSELEQCRRRKHSVLEELFVPIKSSKINEKSSVKLKNDDCKDKKDWMSSAQLWSDNYSESNGNNTNTNKSGDGIETESLSKKESKSAFVPFKEAVLTAVSLPDLSLGCEAVPVAAAEEQCVSLSVKSNENSCHVSGGGAGVQVAMVHESQQQGSKKARRCWSPELHRRFVAALQQLGGAQVATPKQIRDLMKVDGLTNDEVKSHLQKYRLHMRRVPITSSTTIMVTEEFWSSNKEKQNYSKSHQSGSPQGPLQMNSSYSRAVSDSCDDDVKSESCNWK